MNREEAIETLENGAWWDMLETMSCDYAESVKFHAALDMAISALRAQQEPNAPLTLEELREMDGEPVWVEWGGHPQAGWALVRVWSKANNTVYLTYHNRNTDLLGFVLNDGGKIYRRKPEEGHT